MKKYAVYITGIPLLIALLTLTGWLFSIEFLKRPLADNIAMNPTTAIALTVICTTFIINARAQHSKFMAGVLVVLGCAVSAVGALKLASVAGCHFTRVDTWFFSRQIAEETLRGAVNRMAPNSGFNFLLTGIALVLFAINSQRARIVINYLMLMVFVVGMFGFIGFIYQVKEHYGIFNYLPMAVATSISFIFLAVSFLFKNSNAGFMRVISSPFTGGKIARILLPGVLFIPVLFGFIRLYISWVIPFSVELGVAMLITSIIIVFFSVVWFISRALNGSDKARRHAEYELKKQAALFELMPDAVMYGTRNLTITSLNTAAEQLFEMTTANAIGKRVDDIIKVEVMGTTRDEVRNLVWGSAGIWRGETVFTTSSGKRIVALTTIKAINNTSGEDTWMGIYTDITAVKATQQRMQFVLDTLEAGLWEWSIDNNSRWWSNGYYKLLGYEKHELEASGETLQSLLHPDDSILAFTALHNYNNHDKFELELRFKHKDGNYRWFQSTGRTSFGADGKPYAVIGSILDIDEKKRNQQLIEQQAAFIQQIPDSVVYGDVNNNIISINAAAETMLGHKAADAIGKNIYDLVQLKIVGRSRETVRQEFREKGFVRQEVEIINHSQKVMKLLSTARLLNDIPGVGQGWVSIYTDLGPLRMNDDLKAANNYLEQLAYIGAHDIKSPILTLAGLTAMLQKSATVKQNPQDAEVLDLMKSTLQQMQHTNKGLNDILRLRSEMQDLHSEELAIGSLTNIVASVIHELKEDILTSQAKIDIDIQQSADIKLPVFYFHSVFHNLINNALKYRDAGRGLTIAITARQNGQNQICICVEDNGTGFNMAQNKEKVFGMFKRFHNNNSGAGLGLHIVKTIVNSYGGSITAHSTPGHGARFDIQFEKQAA